MERKDVGDVIDKFISVCPRCGRESEVTKTTNYFITRCNSCGFDMGMPRE